MGTGQQASWLRVQQSFCKRKLKLVVVQRSAIRLFGCVLACATVVVTNTSAQTPDVPTTTSVPSKVKTFVIEPDQSDQTFMCESGRVESVQAFSVGEHRNVSIVFLDRNGAPIPAGVWSETFGFRLLHRQTVKIEAALICGG